MVGKIASAADFELVAFKVAGPIGHFCADGVAIALLADQANTEPVIAAACVIAQENGRTVIDRDEDVDGAVVIEIPDGETATGDEL